MSSSAHPVIDPDLVEESRASHIQDGEDPALYDDLMSDSYEDDGESPPATPPAPESSPEPGAVVPASAGQTGSVVETPAPIPGTQTEEGAQPAKPAPPPQVPGAPPPQAEAPALPQQAPTVPAPVVSAPTEAPAPPEDRAVVRERLINSIAESYTISPDDASLLVTEPEKVLPKLVGKLFVDMYESLLATMHSTVPRMIEGHQQVKSQEQEAVQVFFSENPDLNKPEYHPHIVNTARYYNSLFPKASPSEVL